jgi:hypothetical protein
MSDNALSLLDLPLGCLKRILTLAPSLSMCLVCRQFLNAKQAHSIRLTSNWMFVLCEAQSLLIVPDSNGKTRPNKNMEKRVHYLSETIELLVAFVGKIEPTHVPVTLHLLQSLLACLRETSSVLKKVSQGNFGMVPVRLTSYLGVTTQAFLSLPVVGPNFDIFDLSLRRHYYQLQAIYPLRPALDLIHDVDARGAWEARVGRKRHFVSWDVFVSMFLDGYSKR